MVGLAEGTPVRVGVDVLGREWEATIDRVIPAGDPTTRTFDVEIVLPNPHGALKSGMFARARIERAGPDALFVPRSAIVERGQLAGLFVLDGEGVARLRWVRMGREVDAGFEVLLGLVAGESYLPQPPDGIVDGTPVREG